MAVTEGEKVEVERFVWRTLKWDSDDEDGEEGNLGLEEGEEEGFLAFLVKKKVRIVEIVNWVSIGKRWGGTGWGWRMTLGGEGMG